MLAYNCGDSWVSVGGIALAHALVKLPSWSARTVKAGQDMQSNLGALLDTRIWRHSCHVCQSLV